MIYAMFDVLFTSKGLYPTKRVWEIPERYESGSEPRISPQIPLKWTMNPDSDVGLMSYSSINNNLGRLN
jgi:hypothetical protein